MRIHQLASVGCALVGLNLVLAGCSQKAAPPQPAATPAEPSAALPEPSATPAELTTTPGESSATTSAAEQPAEAPAPPREIRVARAESKLPTPPESSEEIPPEPAPLPSAKAPVPLADEAAADLTMPIVSLTHAHAEISLLKVGDTLPNFQLSDLEGHEQSLEKLMGAKLTVVVFWNDASASALEELSDLTPDIADRFAGNGVAVVGIEVGDELSAASQAVKQAGARFPNLSDPDKAAFGQVATARIPRTYLVDSARKILWFDLEYSPTTRRDLVQAIRYTLSNPH